MSYNPQESLENTINTMGTLLGVRYTQFSLEILKENELYE